MVDIDHELEHLLSLDGQEFQFGAGYRVKLEARRIQPTAGQPAGIKYSLTLHDPEGQRIYGLDNAHGIRRNRAYDHRHVHGADKILPYDYQGPTALLEDFFREVERILRERGIK